MVTRRCAIVALALLEACAVAPPNPPPRPMMVSLPVPVPVYCDAPELQKPALPLATLKADSSPADTIRAYAASVELLKGAVIERDQVLDGCHRPPDRDPAPPTYHRSTNT